jgi:hypothetical protein
VAKTKQEIRDNVNLYVTGTEDNLLASWNNTVQDATTLAEMKSTYPGVIGSAVTWFGFATGVNSIYNNSSEIKTLVYGQTLQVSNNTSSKLKMAIYNLSGQKVMEGFVNADSTIEKELTNLSGTYILKCVAENGAVNTRKFILTR